METSWRDVALVDAHSGALTAAGAALLAEELGDERLSVITLLGPSSTQRRRVELFARLLAPEKIGSSNAAADPESALTLLASMTSVEEDWTALVLDVSAAPQSPAWELVGAFCALSSLVVTCFDDDDSGGDSGGAAGWFGGVPTTTVVTPPELPQPFTTLFQTLLREHAVAEVHELLPNQLTLDLSSRQVLRDVMMSSRGGALALRSPRNSDAKVLSDIVQLKQLGVAGHDDVAETQLLEFFAPHAPVKRVFGVELTGELLQRLLQDFARDVLNGEDPDVGSAWDEFVESKCAAVADDALSTYVDCIHSSARERPPIELAAFNKLHDEFQRLAMDVYHSGTKAFKSARKRSVRNSLKASIGAKYDEELQVLCANSRVHCEDVRSAVWTQLSQELAERQSSSDDEGDAVSFAAVLNMVPHFDELYSERASGPERAAVLREFYRHEAIQVFQRLETLVTRRMTEVHLKDLREQLEAEFESKKEALIGHFKQEETQLRACMAREIETMQKMHHARTSRAKIDEGETKRVRDELHQAKQQNVELESHRAVLEQAQTDSMLQRAVLERKVDELEQSVRHEMASRAELVDTLAGTIKSAEAKEHMLSAEIAELRHELGEKTFRVESELKELAAQLKKTNEVGLTVLARSSFRTLMLSLVAGERGAPEAAERLLH